MSRTFARWAAGAKVEQVDGGYSLIRQAGQVSQPDRRDLEVESEAHLPEVDEDSEWLEHTPDARGRWCVISMAVTTCLVTWHMLAQTFFYGEQKEGRSNRRPGPSLSRNPLLAAFQTEESWKSSYLRSGIDDAARQVYALLADRQLYRQTLSALISSSSSSSSAEWLLAASGSYRSVAEYQGVLYVVNEDDGSLWRQDTTSLELASPLSPVDSWTKVCDANATKVAVGEASQGPMLFKVDEEDLLIYRSPIPATPLSACEWIGPLSDRNDTQSLAVSGGVLFLVDLAGTVSVQALSSEQPGLDVDEVEKIDLNAELSSISVVGATTLGIGFDRRLYRQVERPDEDWELLGLGPFLDIALGSAAPLWLPNDPAWAPDRPEAEGTLFVASAPLVEEEPATNSSEAVLGPRAWPFDLLQGGGGGGSWQSDGRGSFMTLDLLDATSVVALRLRGNWRGHEPRLAADSYTPSSSSSSSIASSPKAPEGLEPGTIRLFASPKNMRLEYASSSAGPWTLAVALLGREDGEWKVQTLDGPIRSRWWRLVVVDMWPLSATDAAFLNSTLSPNSTLRNSTFQPPRVEVACRITGFNLAVPAEDCPGRFRLPSRPQEATEHNGIQLEPACFWGEEPHHVFIIGDWGGVISEDSTEDTTKEDAPQTPKPADHRSALYPEQHRPFVASIDDSAQLRVASAMKARAAASRPDYILNVGDNFYWAGLEVTCGARLASERSRTGQWRRIFEEVYTGEYLDGLQWLGVLGNHDWGGFTFTSGWDQTVSYSWEVEKPSTSRWVTPALYWRSKVRYHGFSVDYFFLDTNVYDAFEPVEYPNHNLCSVVHNEVEASCAPQGPASVQDCPSWFRRLWTEQNFWLVQGLAGSSADWQILVTHFPPLWGKEYWQPLTAAYGVDLIIVGHTHQQELHAADDEDNVLQGTAYVVSGGGGGITSQETPDVHGEDDQYGFLDMTLSKDSITVEAISHGGQLRKSIVVTPRYPQVPQQASSTSQARRRRASGQ